MECSLYPEDDIGDSVKLGRNWEIITFLFAGSITPSERPESLLVQDWPDIGGGEASIIDSTAMSAFADWLQDRDDAAILGGYDPRALVVADVYRSRTVSELPVEVLREVTTQIAELRSFAQRCRERGAGAIRVIC